MPLVWLEQQDFGAGAFRSVARQLIPRNGVWSLQNMLLDEDGNPYKRGGDRALTGAAFGSGLRMVWDGFLVGGQRTFVASTDDFGVLDAAGTSVVNLGGAGTEVPLPVAVLGGVMYLPGGVMYAGSRKTAVYSAGTVAVTHDSAALVGTGTAWLANLDAGMLLSLTGADHVYVVESVQDDTHLTLTEPYQQVTGSGVTYQAQALAHVSSPPYWIAPFYGVAGDKLVSIIGRHIYFSAGTSETGLLQPFVNPVDEYHELPAGAEGLGGVMLEDAFLVFSTVGVWQITNVFFPLVDADGNLQRQMGPLAPDLVLWGQTGVVGWRGAAVVPAIDGVWLLQRDGTATKISRSIDPVYLGYVHSAGLRPGQATTFRDHYFLPIVDANGSVVDELVCRLDRPTTDYRGQRTWPWGWFRGHGGQHAAFAVRVGGQAAAREPVLLGAAAGADARVTDCSGFFTPDDTNMLDSDAVAPHWLVELRDTQTGPGSLSTVRKMRVFFESDAGVTGYIGKGEAEMNLPVWGAAVWGAADWADSSLGEYKRLEPVAPPDSGRNGHTWLTVTRSRIVRVRLESAVPAAKMKLRSVAFAVRQSNKDR